MLLRVPDKLSDEQIKEYQRIYKEKYGEDISFEEAEELGMSLVRFMALIINNRNKKK